MLENPQSLWKILADEPEERISKTEARIIEREEKIEQRLDQISQKQDELKQEESIKQQRAGLLQKQKELDGKLGEIAKLSQEEARELYLAQIGEKYESDAKGVIEKYKRK